MKNKYILLLLIILFSLAGCEAAKSEDPGDEGNTLQTSTYDESEYNGEKFE